MSVTSKIDAPSPPNAMRNLDAEQFLLTRRVDGLLREAGVAIDLLGLRRRCGGDSCGPLQEGTAVGKELFG